MAGLENGALQFAVLAKHLKDTGQGELRKKLYKAINDAARPLAEEISSVRHLKPYMPDRYAAVLSTDLAATISKRTSDRDPGVSIRAKGRERKRKVFHLDDGLINHPVFARGPRPWRTWANNQTGGMRPGFFSDPTRDCAPRVRAAILKEMTEIARKATGG
jgi:hypothetical protein